MQQKMLVIFLLQLFYPPGFGGIPPPSACILALAVFAQKRYHKNMLASCSRDFATLALVAFVAATLFCAWSVSAMAMEEPMNDCASQRAEIALCGAGPQGHPLNWQNFLPETPQKGLDLIMASLLFAAGFFVSRSSLHAPPLIEQYIRSRFREGLFIIDPIRRALARGIIQPQIYELAIG